MSPARFRWGILFVLIGGLLLLNNLNVLSWWVWSDILSLWPLLLIAIGVEKIFARSRLQFIAYLAPVALAAIVVWVAFGGFSTGDFRLIRRGDTYRYTVDMEPNVRNIKAVFDLDDTDIRLKDTGTRLFSSRSSGWRAVPRIDYDLSDGIADLDVSPRVGGWSWLRIDGRRWAGDWDVALSNKAPLDLTCYGDRADMTLNCQRLNLEKLLVDSRRGDVRITVGDLSEKVRIHLEGDNADFRITAPEGSGVRVSGAENTAANFLERLGMVETDGYYMTEGYDTLSPQIELDLSPEISRFSLDFR
jgi:hypothetical protein